MNTNRPDPTDHSDPVADVFARARACLPFGEAGDFGFETRLRAALAEPAPGVADWIARFSWGVSAVALPALIAAALVVATRYAALPEGLGGFLSNWTHYLPLAL